MARAKRVRRCIPWMKSMNPDSAESPDERLTCDVSRRFVRVIETLPNGLVSFEFAVGWPELSVELMLPPAAFAEFCERNQVQRLDEGLAPTPYSAH